jgi:glycine betaine/proline transport system substrate-binding protein
MKSELLFSLENVMYNTDGKVDDYMPIVKNWMAEHKDYVDGLTA